MKNVIHYSGQQQLELFESYRNSNSPHILQTLYVQLENMVLKLAHKLAREYGYQLYQDLVQEGVIGLLKCIDVFDPSKANHLSTFAYHYIRGYMLIYIRNNHKKYYDHLSFEEETYCDFNIVDTPSYEADIDSFSLRKEINLLENLTNLEREIIDLYYFKELSLSAIAKCKNVSKQRVSIVHKNAIKKIKSTLKNLSHN